LACVPAAVRAQVGSLVVNITSPASGSTISGTATVTADVTIVGGLVVNNVRFQLDGVNGNIGGGTDNTPPYSVSWDTTTTTNGSHTLVALARSNLGLMVASDPVTVTVNNNTAPPPPPQSTRFEEIDPSVDGTVVETLDTYSPTEGPQHADFFTSGLPRGPHTLTIEVIGKNPVSSDAWILIDAYDVIP